MSVLEQTQGRFGRFWYPKNDVYIGRSLAEYGEFCLRETQLFERILRKGDIVVDAGANIGAMAVPMSQMVGPEGRVFAFEPQPFLAAVLNRNLLENGCENSRVMTLALGADPGAIKVPNYNYAATNNFGGISFKEDIPAPDHLALGIPLARLDDVLHVPSLRLIKADVEGMEVALLAGAKNLITSHQPALYLECDKPDEAAALLDAITELDYVGYWHVSPIFHPDNFKGNKENVFGGVTCVNLCAVPRTNSPLKMTRATGPETHPKFRK